MSRQFNFMPSRYVTPNHDDESRTQRDIGVTECGQSADGMRTTSAVPRDNPGTSGGVTRDTTGTTPGRKPDKSETPEEREARLERSESARHDEWAHKRLIQGLGELRIYGRHSSRPIDMELLDLYFKRHGVPADKGRAAFEAGQQDRARGVRCMCAICNGQRAYEADEARRNYIQCRWRELQAGPTTRSADKSKTRSRKEWRNDHRD
ncbi:MAG TPA: hypothetical protein VN280_22360 [Variovorax sp.]|nr:hypothetical protein [Variovorax sp.]